MGQFISECGNYTRELRKLSWFLQEISLVVNTDVFDGTERDERDKLDFQSIWKSDENYEDNFIKGNMQSCTEVTRIAKDRNVSASDVSPNEKCSVIAEKYMGIGPLIKFDQILFK